MCSSQVLFSFNIKTLAKKNFKLEKLVEFLFCGKFLHSGDKKIHVIHFKVFKAKHGHKLPYFEEKVRI
jgi:hypothetical protein